MEKLTKKQLIAKILELKGCLELCVFHREDHKDFYEMGTFIGLKMAVEHIDRIFDIKSPGK